METIAIGDACEVLNGYAFKSEKYTSSGIRIIRIANVQKGYIEDNSPVFYPIDSGGLEKYMLREGDLLVSLTGNVGRTALLTEDMLPAALNQRVACLRLKTNKITNRFLFHLLNSNYFESKCIQSSQGVAQKNMSTEWLKSYELPLYSLSKQNEIAKILDDARNIIILKEQELQKYDELIKARFIEMFGNLPEDFKHDAVELGSIADVISGGTPSSKHPEYYGDKYPFVTTPCLGSNYISENDAVNWLSDLGVEKSSTHIIPAYSVMYGSRVGVGKSSINTCEMCTNQDILSFYNIDTSTYDLLFIKKVMDQYFEYIDMQKRGSTIKGVPSDVVKAIRIPLVPIEEQKLFAAFAEQSDKSKYDDMYIRF